MTKSYEIWKKAKNKETGSASTKSLENYKRIKSGDRSMLESSAGSAIDRNYINRLTNYAAGAKDRVGGAQEYFDYLNDNEEVLRDYMGTGSYDLAFRRLQSEVAGIRKAERGAYPDAPYKGIAPQIAIDVGLRRSGAIAPNAPIKPTYEAGEDYIRSLRRRAALVGEQAQLRNMGDGLTLDEVSDYSDRMDEIDLALSMLDRDLNAAGRAQKVDYTEQNAMANADFEKMSQQGAQMNKDATAQWRLVNTPQSMRDETLRQASMLGERQALRTAAGQEAYDHMTSEERDVFNYLYATQGNEAANAYLEDLRSSLSTRRVQAEVKESQKLAKEQPLGANLMSVVGTLEGGLVYAESALGKALGQEIDTTDPLYDIARMRSTVREATGENIKDAINNEFLGEAAAFGYQTAISMADSLMAAGLSAVGGGAVGAAMLAGSAANDTMMQAKERGASDDQALILGGLAGVAEALFEKVSIENFLKEASPGVRGAWVRNVLRQMGIEASEESATEVANIITESLVMGDQSQYAGMSAGEIAGQVALAGLGGAISGGAMGGVASTTAAAQNAKQDVATGKEVFKAGAQRPLVQNAFDSNNEAARLLANQLQDGTAKMNNRNVGRLYNLMEYDDPLRKAAMEAAGAQEEEKPTAQTAAAQGIPTQPAQETAQAVADEGEEDYTLPEANAPAVAQTRTDAARSNITDEDIVVNGIDSVDDGTVFVLSDMEKIPAADVQFADPQTAALYDAASEFDTATAQRFVAGYEGGDVQQYIQSFTSVYKDGQAGIPYEVTLKQRISAQNLTENQRLDAYAGGMASNRPTVNAAKLKPGLTRSYTKASLSREAATALKKHRRQIEAIDVMAKKYGRKVVLVSSLEGMTIGGETIDSAVNGAYDRSTGTIYIAADAQDGAFAYVAMHEMVHSIRKDSADNYNRLRDTVFEALEAAGEDVDALTKYQMDKFHYDEDTAIEEVIANTAPTVLTDKDFVHNLYANDRSLFDKIKAFIDDLKKVFAKLTQSGSWAQDASLSEESVRKIADVFDEVARGDLSQEGGVKLSVRDSLMGDLSSQKTFSYENLVKQPPMNVLRTPALEDIMSADDAGKNKIDRNLIRDTGLENARAVMSGEINGNPAVRNIYSGIDIVVTGSSIRHSIDGGFNRMATNGKLGAIIGDIVRNAIPINSIDTANENAEDTLAFVGYAKDGDREYLAVCHVNRMRNMLTDVEWVDVLHSLNGRTKKDTSRSGEEPQLGFPIAGTDVIISIADLIDIVKELHPDLLSRDVIENHYGEVWQPEGYYKGKTKFSAKDPVERKGTLLAIHNLTGDKLKKFLALGGAPMPSIAITRSDVEHGNFGDISLIFDKSTIDPKANKKNVVYSADTWTPTFPQIEYEADSKVENAAYHTLHDLMGKMESYFADDLKRVIYGVDDMLNRQGGEQGFIEYAMNNMGMKAAHLESKGVHIDRMTKQQEKPKGFSDERVDKYQAITEILGTTDIIELMSMPLNELKDKYGEQLEAVFPGMTKSAMRMSNIIKQTGRWLAYDSSGALYDEVTDYDAMRQAVEDRVDAAGFSAWVHSLYDGIEADSGVYNGKDLYTASGNRRSFAATHYPATLENIAKAMAAQNNGNTKNVSGFNGIKTLRAGMAVRFKNIADMHKLEGRLQSLTQEEADALNDALSDRMYDLMKRIDLYRKSGSVSNSFERMDNIGTLMMEVADSGRYSVDNVKDVFTKSGMAISNDVANDVVKLLFDVQQMPVNLFEAKPERAVYTDEVKLAVLPEGEYTDIEKQLVARGIPVEHYDPNVEGDRVRVMNSPATESLRFSMRDTTPANTRRLERENTKLKTALSNARAQLKLTSGHEVSRPAVERLARKIIRTTQSKVDASKLANDLMQIYSYAATSGNSDTALREIDSIGIGVAKKVIQQAETIDTMTADQLSDLKEYLRTTGITLNESQRADAAAMYGSYNAFRKEYFGKIKLTKDGVPLDVAWGELNQQYPWLFNAEGDNMVETLAHAVELTKPEVVNPYGDDIDGAAADLWLTIQDEYTNLPEVRTFADKQKAKMDELKAKQKRLIAEMRQDAASKAKQRIADTRTAERIAEGRKQAAAQQKADARMNAQQERSEARIAALEARIRELEQQVKDERAAGQINAAVERRAGRQAVQEARTAERMAEGRIRAEERQRAAERLDAQKQRDAEKLREVREQRDQKRKQDLREQREAIVWQRKERDEQTKYRERIMANAKTLTAWLTRPTDEKHVPESMRKTIARFLETLEWGDGTKHTKKGDLWRSRLTDMLLVMERIDKSADEGQVLDIDPDLTSRMEEFLGGVPDTITSIGNLNTEQLRDLDYILQTVKRTVVYANRLRANTKYQQISALGDASMKEMDSLKGKRQYWQIFDGVDKFFNIQQLDSFAFFDGLGEAASSVLQELRAGFDAKIRHVEQAIEYVKPFIKGINMRELSGKGAPVHEFDVSGGKLKMTTAQIMELYELLKREQARGHIFGGGIRVADISRGLFKTAISRTPAVQITVEEANRIVDTLTKEQRDLADRMAWFLGNECAAWGNQTSVLMYGYKKFNEENYYPIRSDSNAVQTTDKNDKNQQGAFAALKNLGMTKAVQKGANNPVIVGDIFDTFTRHVDDMASYNGLMIPLSDAMKWFNYKEKTDTGKVTSIKQSMERRAGKHAQEYFKTLIKNLNGINDRGERIALVDGLTSNAKAAAIGANMRVVLQQPTAYIRAAAVIDPKYLAQGMKRVLSREKVAEAQKYCPIAMWKSWGFYEISVGKDMRSLLFNDGNFVERMKEWSMAPAGWADQQTFGTLYMACLAEAKDKHSNLSEEAQKEIAGHRLSEIVDRTQVVDSPFHKSQIMRSKDGLTKMYTSFMSEPTKSYNLLRTAIVNAAERRDKDAYKALARTAVAWLLTATATSAMAAIADAGRDEDETKTVLEKYGEALTNNIADNVNPLNMVPVVKDVFSLLQGFEPSRMDMQAADKLNSVVKVWIKQLSAERGEKPYTFGYMAYQTAQAISTMTGLPAANLMREVNSVANLFGVGLKTKTSVASVTERYEKLYGAIVEGKDKQVQRIEAALKEDDKSPKDIDSGIAKVLAEQDERIAEAYEAREDGDIETLDEIRDELAELFGEETVDKALNLYENGAEKEPTEKNPNEELSAPLFDYADMEVVALQAFETGDTDALLRVIEEIKADSDAQDPDNAVRTKATTLFKPVYLKAKNRGYTKQAARIKKILIEVFGMKEENIDKWKEK